MGFTKPYSEKTAEVIDNEVKLIIEESFQRALDVLNENMKGLTELAELLLEKEVIFTEDLERIFGKRKADVLKELQEAEVKALDKAIDKAKTKARTEDDKEDKPKPGKKEVKKKSDDMPLTESKEE
jgi:cell division protease FtsH